jgi:DNA-binding transcriptional MerR regulator
MKLGISEFSLVTSMSIKALRLYHEKGLLLPAEVDPSSGYRYYDESNLERARSIQVLKLYDFSLAEIKELLDACNDESDMLSQLEEKLARVESKIDRYQEISRAIRSIVEFEKEAAMDKTRSFEIEEKDLDTMLIAGHRMQGRYEEMGKGLGLVCRKMGRHAAGKPMALYYDGEYKEEGADFEPCIPVRKGKDVEGISIRELKGGKCVSLIHKGPYENLRHSYGKVFSYLNEKGYKVRLPTREVYRKGPGLIFKGNSNNYLTEIQVMIEA